MRFMINMNGEPAIGFSFANGYSVNVSGLPCGCHTVVVGATYLVENREYGMKYMRENRDKFNEPALIAAGDMLDHFTGADEELLAFLDSVAKRPTEPHLAGIGAEIMKAAKA